LAQQNIKRRRMQSSSNNTTTRASVRLSRISFKNILPKSKLTKAKKRSSQQVQQQQLEEHRQHQQLIRTHRRHESAQEVDEITDSSSIAEYLNESLSPCSSQLALKSVSDYHNLAECYKEALRVVFLPISSQFVGNLENSEEYAYVGLRLVQTIRKAFHSLCTQFDQVWNLLHMEAFPSDHRDTPFDHAIYNLLLTKQLISDASYEYFSKDNFTNEKEFQQWRKLETEFIDQLVEKAKLVRLQSFLLRTKIDSISIRLDNKNKDFTGRQDVFCKVRASDQAAALLTSKLFKCTVSKDESIRITIHDVEGTIDFKHQNQDLVLHFYRKNMVNSERFGEARIPLKDFIHHLLPSNCAWAVQPFESEYPITYSTKNGPPSNRNIGKAFLTLTFQMEQYPSQDIAKMEQIVEKRKRRTTNYHGLLDILVHQLIESNSIDKDKDRKEVLDFNQQWIIQEFCSQHGISEVYKRLSIMREMVQNNELLLMCIEQFKESIDFVHCNIKQRIYITTQHEIRLLALIKKELAVKLEAVISKFMTLQKKKRKVLKVLIELLQYVLTSDGSMTKEQFGKHLSTIIATAVEYHFDCVRDSVLLDMNIKEITPAAIAKLTNAARLKIEEIFEFSLSIPAYCKYETTAVKVFVDRLRTEFNQVEQNVGFTGYQMLLYCQATQEFNEEIYNNFSKKELSKANIQLIDALALGEKYADKYMVELKELLMGQMKRSVQLDKWKRINDEVLHSSSVVDIFTSATQTLDFIHHIDFMQEELLANFAKTVGEVIVEYAKIVQELCLKDVMKMVEPVERDTQSSQDSSPVPRSSLSFVLNLKQFAPATLTKNYDPTEETISISTEYVVKLNDIEAARAQYKEIIQALTRDPEMSNDASVVQDDHSNADENTDTDTDSDTSDSEDEAENTQSIENTPAYLQTTLASMTVVAHDLDTLIVGQFRPFVKNILGAIVDQLNNTVKKNDMKLSNEEIKQRFGTWAMNYFKDQFLEFILSPNLATLSENIYESGFSSILEQLFTLIMSEFANMLIPAYSLSTTNQEGLNKVQLLVMKVLIKQCEEYFYGDGEGLSKPAILRGKKFLDQVFQLFELDTQRLISLYSQFHTMQDTSKYAIKGYHILAVLNERSPWDKEAKQFYNIHKKEAIELYLMQEFCISESATNSEILMVHSSYNGHLMKGKYYLLTNYLLWIPNLSLIKRKDNQFCQNRTAVDRYSGKFKVYLGDITQVEPRNSLVKRKIVLHLNGHAPLKVYFRRSKKRDRLLNALLDQCKKQNYCAQKKDTTRKRGISLNPWKRTSGSSHHTDV
jgi:hypothetical protein